MRGPPTVATAITLPSRPEYRPRSRGLIIAAIAICTSACRPPRPRPCSTRQAISVSHRLGEPGQHRADDEDDDGQLDQQLLAEQVGELAPDRGGRGRGQQGGGDDPGVLALGAPQVGDDRRQGVGDDRPRQERHEHRQHHPGERREDLPVRHGALLLGRGASTARPARRCWSCCSWTAAEDGRAWWPERRGSGSPAGPRAVPGGPSGAPGRPPRGRPARRSSRSVSRRASCLAPVRRGRRAPSRRAWRGSRRGPRCPRGEAEQARPPVARVGTALDVAGPLEDGELPAGHRDVDAGRARRARCSAGRRPARAGRSSVQPKEGSSP